MSKSPDEIDALLLRIRTMKWQAVTVLSSSSSGLAREEAAAVFATLHAIESAIRNGPASETIKAVRERIDALGRLRDHEPVWRAAGRSQSRDQIAASSSEFRATRNVDE